MLEVFARANRQKIAILQNASNIQEQEKLNAISYLTFSLPYNDPKNEACQAYNYVRYNGGQLYRIIPKSIQKDEAGSISYTCEHVIATLLDNVLFGYHVVGGRGVYTKECIAYVLGKQLTKNWVLGQCDFSREFEYGWEQENLLAALFSIPQPLSELYQWSYDTNKYPWTLNLKKIDLGQIPGIYIRDGHNLTKLQLESDTADICTRLYPLGYGEGVNQLGIQSVNKGVPYLQSPKAYTDRYGIVERVWIDRRYENPESLKAAAQSMLEELQEPAESYQVSFANLTAADQNTASLGEVAQIVDQELGIRKKTLITEITRNYDEIESSTIVLKNRAKDIADTVADLADRQRIEMTYSQGATQIYSQSIQGNASKEEGLVMDFFVPDQMRIVNKILCKVRMGRFRAYSKATTAKEQQSSTTSSTTTQSQTSSSGGGTSRSTGSGGGSEETSASGGAKTVTSGGGGGAAVTSSNGADKTDRVEDRSRSFNSTKYAEGNGSHRHDFDYTVLGHNHIMSGHTHNVNLPSHTHEVSIGSHTHKFEVPSHSHDFNVPSHTHSFSIPGHKHSFTIPAHSHEITPGIYYFGSPKTFGVYLNGKLAATYTGTDKEIDLTNLLVDQSTGKIPRGAWQNLEIRPNDLAYISIALSVQGFVQSRGDATV